MRWYSPRDWIEDEDTPPPPATPPSHDTPPPPDAPTIQSPDVSHDHTERSPDSPTSKLEVSVSADSADGWEGEDWAVIESDNEVEATNKETEAKPKRVRNFVTIIIIYILMHLIEACTKLFVIFQCNYSTHTHIHTHSLPLIHTPSRSYTHTHSHCTVGERSPLESDAPT